MIAAEFRINYVFAHTRTGTHIESKADTSENRQAEGRARVHTYTDTHAERECERTCKHANARAATCIYPCTRKEAETSFPRETRTHIYVDIDRRNTRKLDRHAKRCTQACTRERDMRMRGRVYKVFQIELL